MKNGIKLDVIPFMIKLTNVEKLYGIKIPYLSVCQVTSAELELEPFSF